MNRKQRSVRKALTQKVVELGIAAPVVVAHRTRRMTKAYPTPNESDRREFTAMVLEKQIAFVSSWFAMFAQCWKLQQSLAAQWMRAVQTSYSPFSAARSISALRPATGAALSSIALAGIVPVHRKAVSNAKRLSRQGRR